MTVCIKIWRLKTLIQSLKLIWKSFSLEDFLCWSLLPLMKRCFNLRQCLSFPYKDQHDVRVYRGCTWWVRANSAELTEPLLQIEAESAACVCECNFTTSKTQETTHRAWYPISVSAQHYNAYVMSLWGFVCQYA